MARKRDQPQPITYAAVGILALFCLLLVILVLRGPQNATPPVATVTATPIAQPNQIASPPVAFVPGGIAPGAQSATAIDTPTLLPMLQPTPPVPTPTLPDATNGAG